jgi:hypothetical protein
LQVEAGLGEDRTGWAFTAVEARRGSARRGV